MPKFFAVWNILCILGDIFWDAIWGFSSQLFLVAISTSPISVWESLPHRKDMCPRKKKWIQYFLIGNFLFIWQCRYCLLNSSAHPSHTNESQAHLNLLCHSQVGGSTRFLYIFLDQDVAQPSPTGAGCISSLRRASTHLLPWGHSGILEHLSPLSGFEHRPLVSSRWRCLLQINLNPWSDFSLSGRYWESDPDGRWEPKVHFQQPRYQVHLHQWKQVYEEILPCMWHWQAGKKEWPYLPYPGRPSHSPLQGSFSGSRSRSIHW